MNSPRNQTWGFEATLTAISALPEAQQADALLHVLTNVLRDLPAATLRRKRTQFLERFSQCGCSLEVVCAVQDLVDLHLARADPRKTGGGKTRNSRL